MSNQPKIALVHDDFCQLGGAENLFAQIAQIYPEVPIYTAIINKETLPIGLNAERVKTSWMQKIPFALKFFKLLLPLYPLAFESFDFSSYDLVISSTTRFAKGIITKPGTLHICYINSTPRFLWHPTAKSHYHPGWISPFVNPTFAWLKRWDKAASSRPDYLIGNSENVRADIGRIYKRESAVVYPFADTDFFTHLRENRQQLKANSYYLIVSRLVKWKRVDLAIKACAKLGVNLKIVGTGPDEKRLKQITSTVIPSKEGIRSTGNQILDQVTVPERSRRVENDKSRSLISFLGQISREQLRDLYQNARALIVTQEEDFGISTVEANACGIPVIAYEKGGQKEIIVRGVTGLFFDSQSQKSLEDAILTSSKVKWDVSACRKNSLRFSKAIFVKDFQQAVAGKVKDSSYL